MNDLPNQLFGTEHRRIYRPNLSFASLLILLIVLTVGGLSSCRTVPPPSGTASGRICPATDGDYHELSDCAVIQGDLILERIEGTALPDLRRLRRVTGSLIIRQSPRLNHLEGLQNIAEVGGELQLVNLPALASLDGLGSLRIVGGDLHLIDLGISECRAEALVQRLRQTGFRGNAELLGLEPGDDCPAEEAPAYSNISAEPPADLPLSRLPELDEIRRGDLLEKMHPELVDRARLLYALLEKEGIEIRFISGHRPYVENYRPNRLATWHNLGMAFDLNIVGRDYAYYDEDEEKWARIGEIATGLGIIWGIRYDDIFHFEWHPDYHARIRQHEFELFQDLAGDRLQQHEATWHLYSPELADPDALPCFGGCHQIPDEGLRHLLDRLR